MLTFIKAETEPFNIVKSVKADTIQVKIKRVAFWAFPIVINIQTNCVLNVTMDFTLTAQTINVYPTQFVQLKQEISDMRLLAENVSLLIQIVNHSIQRENAKHVKTVTSSDHAADYQFHEFVINDKKMIYLFMLIILSLFENKVFSV